MSLKLGLGLLGGAVAVKALDSAFDLHLGNDLKFIGMAGPALVEVARFARNNLTVADFFHNTVDNWPERIFLESMEESRVWTYGEIDRLANRIAAWFITLGIKQKDVVSLFMLNRPEYVAVWLAATKIGAVCSLLNTNIRGAGFEHSLNVCKAKVLIFGPTLDIEDVKKLTIPVASFCFPTNHSIPWAKNLDLEISRMTDERPPAFLRSGINTTDPAILIYTSGTTGLPKAGILNHVNIFSKGVIFARGYEVTGKDRIYCVLPLYHTSAGICGVGMAIYSAACLITKVKFSASQFWDDCRKSNATVFQHIGELCRYLLLQPPSPKDVDHSIRIAIGNGLRPDIWSDFQDRFGIPEIGEFYGATEGNIGLSNHSKDLASRGCLGVTGVLLQKIMKMKLAKYDVESDELVRDKNGFLIECKPDEPGELLGAIDSTPSRQFAGYYGNEKGTNSKILKNAFVKGDMYFRTGDLLRQDKKRRWYFVDRIGDTFRYKGENVSTNEVSECVSGFPGVQEANVYGVEIPGVDGRGCMVAMTVSGKIDFDAFASHCVKGLPSYAIPLFVRLQQEMDHTGTFKQQKVQLRKEGIDVSLYTDQVFKFNGKTTYLPFTSENYQEMKKSTSKL